MNGSKENALSRFTFEDLVRIKDLLSKKENELIKQLEQVQFQLKEINTILALNKNRDETFGVFLPKNFFVLKSTSENISGSSKSFNWKSVALQILKDHKGLMTTDMIYEKARILYPSELTWRANAIRNFSSALYYLAGNGKVLRYKENGSREFIYGLLDQFDLKANKPKEEYMKIFKKEKAL